MAKKSSSNFFWGLVAGSVAMYFLKDHVQDLVGSLKGSMDSARARSYHARNRRGAGLPQPVRGWQRPGFPGQGNAYGRTRRFQQFY